VINTLGVTEPMVGWKQAPLSAVTSCSMVLISVFLPYVLNCKQWMHVSIYMSIKDSFSVLND
jgi:hypothetical protein